MTSQAQIYALALGAGLTPARAKTAAAIAMAESGGNPAAHNTAGRDDSYGLWQINMKGSLGPARRKQLGLAANADLLDPATNAHAMAVISRQGASFVPWTTYVDGAYLAHLSGSTTAGLHLPLPSLPSIPDVTAPFRDFGQIVVVIAHAAAWVSNSENWVRVLYVVGGLVVGVAGVSMLIKGTPVGTAATKAATTAAKVI